MDRHIGIVLGGGGLLGDFQVGALKYLYRKHKVTDDEIACVSGTSVGAINGAILATGEGCTDRLERFWLQNVTTPRDILEEEMWFEGISPLLNKVVEGAPLARISAVQSLIKGVLKETRDHLFEQGLGGLVNINELLTNVLTRQSLYTTAVLKERLKLVDLRKALRSKIALRLYAAELDTGECTCFCTKSYGEGAHDDECTKYVECTTREQLADAALASAALPGVFPPLKVRGKYYVDGSVREVVPIKGMLGCGVDTIYVILCMPRLTPVKDGADECADDAKKIDWGSSHLVDIALQSAKILVDELVNDDLRPSDTETEPVEIAPLVTAHGMTDLSIGRIKINMDQGYMRAYDEVGAASDSIRQQCAQLTSLITSKRLAIWQLEHDLIEQWSTVKHRSPLYDYYPWHLFDPRRMFSEWMGLSKVDTTILCKIRDKKRELKKCIDKRLAVTHDAESLPDCFEGMYLHWEQHNWDLESPTKQPVTPSPWDRFDLGRHGTRVIPEEEPPETTPLKAQTRPRVKAGSTNKPPA